MPAIFSVRKKKERKRGSFWWKIEFYEIQHFYFMYEAVKWPTVTSLTPKSAISKHQKFEMNLDRDSLLYVLTRTDAFLSACKIIL